jgi:pyruvate, orthophosphate dikinase
MAQSPWLFPFRTSAAELPPEGNELLGRKGANLAAMCSLGFPVPPGFTVATSLCHRYLATGALPDDFDQELRRGIAELERLTGRHFGARRRPLLVSARSGAAVSMPGMMDTVLNLGLTEESVEGLMRLSGNPRFAWDSFRRLIAMFGDVVCGAPRHEFEEALTAAKQKAGVIEDYELDAKSLRDVAHKSLEIFERHTGRPFPQDPYQQLREATEAVFRSWESDRAREYRRLHRLEGLAGTAVTIQAMVFGNSGGDSGTGVAFTRDPVTGTNELYVDFLYNAQGEDIVAGIRNPETGEELRRDMPAVYDHLLEIRKKLESNFRDMQDIEFTVEDGSLFLLQTRAGKRSARAALRIAVDMVSEGQLPRREALERLRDIDPAKLATRAFAHPIEQRALASAFPAAAGVAVGRIALTSEKAVELANAGEAAILVREETSADDIAGMAVARGILTARGGRTSHAAVVARQMGITCLVGCRDLRITLDEKSLHVRDETIREGDWLSLDGVSGQIYAGQVPVVAEGDVPELSIVRSWIEAEALHNHPLRGPAA